MKKKVAVLLDMGCVRYGIKALTKRLPIAADFHAFAMGCVESDESLFRIYCYDCWPSDAVVQNPISKDTVDLKTTKAYKARSQILNELSLMNHVALRSGTLSGHNRWVISDAATKDFLNGVRTPCELVAEDLEPDFTQKKVDMKIGLDVAWLASKKVVDKIILAATDSDFIPAMKFARAEGVEVVLVEVSGAHMVSDMRVHSDVYRKPKYP